MTFKLGLLERGEASGGKGVLSFLCVFVRFNFLLNPRWPPTQQSLYKSTRLPTPLKIKCVIPALGLYSYESNKDPFSRLRAVPTPLYRAEIWNSISLFPRTSPALV